MRPDDRQPPPVAAGPADAAGEADIRRLQARLERNPRDAETCRALGAALWHAGRRIEAYLTVLAGLRASACVELHVQAALFYACEEDYPKAQQHLMTAASLDPGSAEVHRYLGLVDAAMGQPVAAARRLERALYLRPDDVTLAYELAVAARASQSVGEPIRMNLPARPAVAADRPGSIDGEAVDALLDSPLAMERPTLQAIERQLAAAVDRRGDQADIRLRYSRVLDRLDMAASALRQARKAVQLRPNFAQAHLHLAGLYQRAGRLERATQAVLRAIACGADWPDAHCLAAELLGRNRRIEGARIHLQRALQLNPTYRRAGEQLARLAA